MTMKLSVLNESLGDKLPCKAPWSHLASDLMLDINAFINRHTSDKGFKFHIEYKDVNDDKVVDSQDVVAGILELVFENFVRKYITLDANLGVSKSQNRWNESYRFLIEYPHEVAAKMKIDIGGKVLSIKDISTTATDLEGFSAKLANKFIGKLNSVIITIDNKEALNFKMSCSKK